MSGIFWMATIVMAVIAFGFIAAPLRQGNRRVGLLGAALAMPFFAASMYWFIGSPQAAVHGTSSSTAQTPPAGSPSKPVGSVASMVDGLASRLAENPDDGKGWLLLARSYKHLNQVQEAKSAYERATALGEYDADLAELAGPSGSTAQAGATIYGSLRLSDRSRQIVMPTDTVFIFARAIDGPPMPIAVLQRPASDLPLDFMLNDSQAMSADAKLSNFEQVTVTARISRSGVATDALKGLEARSETITLADNRHLDLTIE